MFTRLQCLALYSALAVFFIALLVVSASGAPQAKISMDSRWAVRTPEIYEGRPFPGGPNGVEQTVCRPLQYFLDNQVSDYAGAEPGPVYDTVASTRVGEVRGFTIYSIIHNIGYREKSENANIPTYIKMIVVERKHGEFCEIYNDHNQRAILEGIWPAYLVVIGSETLLASKDEISGHTGGGFQEEYWTFDQNGPIPLDLSVVDRTVHNLLPKGFAIVSNSGFNMEKLSFENEADCRPCDSSGRVSIKFALKDHQLAVVSQKFDPNPKQ